MKKDATTRNVFYSDVFYGRLPSINLLHEVLCTYSCVSVLRTISAVTFLRGAANLNSEWNLQKHIWRALVRGCFGERETRRKIGDDAQLLFGRPILLLLAREAIRVCPDIGKNMSTES